jgi:hypothetical protein
VNLQTYGRISSERESVKANQIFFLHVEEREEIPIQYHNPSENFQERNSSRIHDAASE